MRAILVAGLLAAAFAGPSWGQAAGQCTSCPSSLTITRDQWTCLSPRLSAFNQSARNPVFVPLPAAPDCNATLSTGIVHVPAGATKAAPAPTSPSTASAYLTKPQLACLSQQAAQLSSGAASSVTVNFAQCH